MFKKKNCWQQKNNEINQVMNFAFPSTLHNENKEIYIIIDLLHKSFTANKKHKSYLEHLN